MREENAKITPPMRSAGMVACEQFMRERTVKNSVDRDELVCAVFTAMDTARFPTDKNRNGLGLRLCRLFRSLFALSVQR